ncbi:hypothetical protein C0Q70_16299 [Pomacea canaliculata]|uniref:Reverse transcriptase domain-containing protein n=1 Tax=Pomacea canaliculata TaxID=400727 RepID=A0A2T7NPE0_POMCA|nr:hypothetical protein C0Q70_16299 [Pomacea canaliculata]
MSRPGLPRKTVYTRNVRGMDSDSFRTALQRSALLVSPPDNVDELVALYNSTLTALLDKFAPVKKVRQAKKVRRQAERKWRKSRLEVDRQIYRHTRSQCSAIIVKARSRYVMNIVSSAVSDSRKMFAVVNGLLGKDVTQPVLPEMDDQTAASTLSAYFEDKIKTIMDSFSDSVDTVEQTSDLFCGTPLSNFQPVTEDELLKLVRRCRPTTSVDDPIPTSVLLQHLDILLPVLVRIVNASLFSASVPRQFKTAVIKPILKKPQLGPELV